MRMRRALAPAVIVCFLAVGAAAQTPPQSDVTTLSLKDLLEVEVVSTASKFPQDVREAPASITVITADEIRRYGHRTLADVLRSVRGLYTTYDRNYTYVGVRGFARPGDYNTRVLLLIDGHRLNDPIYDMAPIGTDFPIDVSLIDKVEVIRGPGSSLYGTNAFFAVINVITRTGSQERGVRASTYAGSLGTRGATASVGKLFANAGELMVAGSHYRSSGADSLYFPEVEAAGIGDGVATGLDDDRASSVLASFALGRVAIRGAMNTRRKQVPTGSFETVFGDPRLVTRDDRAYVSAEYDGPFTRGWLGTARVAYDYYGYEGVYPFDYGEPGTIRWIDGARSDVLGGEVTARKRVGKAHLFTVGVDVRRQLENRMTTNDDFGLILDIRMPGTIVGTYAQDEIRVRPWFIVNAGVRLDRYPSFGSHLAPRVGLVLMPHSQTSIKILHGGAFRAPNPYELAYFDAMRLGGLTLDPETVQSTEVIWEQYFSRHLRTSVTAFGYDAENIVEQRTIDFGGEGPQLYFANTGDVEAIGVEGEIEAVASSGVSVRFSHTFADGVDKISGERPFNSPRHLSKLALQIPISRLFVGIEGQYVGERLALDGAPIEGFFTPNVAVTTPAARRLEFTLGLYNAFNRRYADPGGEEHVQRAIPQDGRTLLARVRARF